jgi:hypothetical protein
MKHAIMRASNTAPANFAGGYFLHSRTAVGFYGVGTTTVTEFENGLSIVSDSTAVTQ